MRKALYNFSKHENEAVLGNTPRLYFKHSALWHRKDWGHLFLLPVRDGSFVWSSGLVRDFCEVFLFLCCLPAHRALTWLRGRDVKVVSDTDWLRGSEQMVLTDSHLYALCVKSGWHHAKALSLLRCHGDEGNTEPKNRLLSATEAQRKGKFSFQANVLYFNGVW